MDIYKKEIAKSIQAEINLPLEEIIGMIAAAPPEVEGDLALPCFGFSRLLRKAPKIIAEELASRLQFPEIIGKVSAVNGYLNFILNKQILVKNLITEIRESDMSFGSCRTGENQKVVIDFSSPNMGKELAFHHMRGTMLGNSLSRIYEKCGYQVVRVNHLGDWGTSYGKLILMYVQEGLPEDGEYLSKLTIEQLNHLYQSFGKASQSDPALEDEARKVFRQLENGDTRFQKLWHAFRETTLTELKRIYALLDVRFDDYTGESFFVNDTPQLLEMVRSLPEYELSRETEIVNLEKYGIPPLMLRKSDGTTLYATRDLCAAIYRKAHYHFNANLYVVDNGQSLHFQQFFKVLELLGHTWHGECVHVPFGLILTLGEEGRWEKGKTRVGGVSLLKDVLSAAALKILEIINDKNPELEDRESVAMKIGIGALVFNDLKTRRQHNVNFDWDSVLSFEGDTGPYVVNAHVRLCSILGKAASVKKTDIHIFLDQSAADFSNLCEEAEMELIMALSQFPDRIRNALSKNETSVLCQYMLFVAERVHRFIHHCRVLGSPQETERLLLADCARIVLRNAMHLAGIPIVEKM